MSNKYIGSVLIIMILFTFVIFNMVDKPMYGNDTTSITQVIHSFDLYKEKSIELLEVYDYDRDRIVTFLSDSSPSIIQFEKNDQGNYIFLSVETDPSEQLGQFIVNRVGENEENVVISVRNHDSAIEKFSFKANEILYTVSFDSKHPNSTLTLLEASNVNGYEFEWYVPEEKG